MSMQEAQQLFTAFKASVEKGDHASAQASLVPLKKMMMDLDSLPPLLADSPNAAEERNLFRQVLEYAVLLSVNTEDRAGFQRYMSSLHPYYALQRRGASSEVTAIVLGLNLLYFLVENRLADFHCELEFLSEAQRVHPAVLFSSQLEKFLVVGAYDRVLEAALNPPVEAFQFFLSSLKETVRTNIGECMAAAYSSIDLPAASKLLMFSSTQETVDFISTTYPDWEVLGGVISFAPSASAGSACRLEEGVANRLIAQTLSYATELERIV